MRAICLLAVLLVCSVTAYCGNIRGHVLDEAGEPAIGAIVKIENTTLGDAAGLDGSYIIKNVPVGHYKLTIILVGYEKQNREADIKSDADEVMIDIRLIKQSRQLENVVVISKNVGGNDAGARQLEKKADNVLNILSQRTIQLMPDVTVANVLRRVSGVTVDRSNDGGEGRYPVIRGMDKRYNYTLINGIKIPSPDDKNRYVPMDIFPSEMLQRLEVVKALTADMEGDAIGGVMNLVMRDAPEQKMIQAQVAFGYAQMVADDRFTKYDYHSANSKSPAEINGADYSAKYSDFTKSNLDFKKVSPLPDAQLNLTLGNRFFQKKLGLVFSGSYQSSNRNGKETYFEPNAQPNPTTEGNDPSFSSLQLRNYSTHQERIGLHGKADYVFNTKNKISFYTVLMKLNSYQSRYTVDTPLTVARTMPGVGQVELHSRSSTRLQTIYNATLQGQHQVTNQLSADWSLVYSRATNKTPDQAELALTQQAYIDSTTHMGTATNPTILSIKRFWQHNSDQDIAGYLNLHYSFKINDQQLVWSAGGMYRHKNRDNYFNQYKLSPATAVAFTSIYDADLGFYGSSPRGSQTGDDNIYSATENISAGYTSLRWEPGKNMQVLAGIRAEHTEQSYDQTVVPVTKEGKAGTITYTDILPDVHLKYNLNGKEAIRLSYFKAISRPGYFELIPYTFPGDDYIERGNYNLKHTQAHNLDLRYERFPGGADQVLAGVFYKKINNAIGYVYDRIGSETILRPDNIGTATNFGIELVYTKYFRRFGISANYTYTYSDIPVSKKLYYYNGHADTVRYETEHIPLQGQAAHIANLSLLYKDTKKGTDIQLAAVYTGRHIVYVSPYLGLDYWARGVTVLDLSGEQRLGKHFAVYLKVNNLLNSASIVELTHDNKYLEGTAKMPEQTRTDRILVDKRQFGQNYLVGFRYHL